MTIEWIPVSEELPANSRFVLVSMADGQVDIAYRTTQAIRLKMHHGWNLRSFGYFVPDGEHSDDEVLAWAPLPEAYKEEA